MTSVKLTTHELAKKWLSETDKIVLIHDSEYGHDLACDVKDCYVQLTEDEKEVLVVEFTPAEGYRLAVAIR